MKLKLKFCGGCNPIFDRSAMARRIIERLHWRLQQRGEELELVSFNADLALVVNGCGSACADLEAIRDQTRAMVMVNGESVDYFPVPATDLCERAVQALFDTYNHLV